MEKQSIKTNILDLNKADGELRRFYSHLFTQHDFEPPCSLAISYVLRYFLTLVGR